MNRRALIIAEAGVNHNGSLDLAKKLAYAAKSATADFVKYQTFIPQNLVSASAKMADYQAKNIGKDESQFKMLKGLALSFEEFAELKQYCEQIEIGFLSTPFDFESIEFLEKLEMPFWKVPSGEVTNVPYLVKIAQTGKDVIMSTGMCNEAEIRFAIGVLEKYGAGEITLLHCNTEYPTPFEDVNIRAMLTLKEKFCKRVGYSDHTQGIEVPVAAVAMGAAVIEKHFTLDRNMEGPDHKASLEPDEFSAMIDAIRHVELAMGSGEKKPSASESKNINVVRKSIVAKTFIAKGDLFSEENLTTKRPGDGISPTKWFDVIGRTAERDFQPDEKIDIKER